jgi:peptide/nickel transport system substrate-binding protein
MDRETKRRFEAYRRDAAGPVENTLLDELTAGELDRATFLRRASVLGLSASVVGTALAWLGEAPLAFAAPVAARAGGRARVGIIPGPTKDLEPHTLADLGGFEAAGIAGEFLTRTNTTLQVTPELATSWKANAKADVWTFKLRQGVKFQSGQTFGADDVVATYKRLTNPKSGSTAISAFGGVLTPAGVRKVDDQTVAFHLESPNANFPYLTCETTYQAIILPADYKVGTFTTTPQTTGAFQLTSYNPGVGSKYDRFDGWWGGMPALDGVDATYYTEDAAVVSALLGGQLDLVGQINVTSGRAILNNPNAVVIAAHGASHREICMRVDADNPFKDRRVRQALALTLDRPAIVKTLFSGYADLGNDSPFAPVYPSTNKSVPQRRKNIAKAKQLMAAAGYPHGFSITLTTEQVGEIPQLAQILQRSAKQIGINIKLNVMTSAKYFAGTYSGGAKGWGTTPWLNAPLDITDWGHRPVPNVYLTAAFVTKGQWNAAHYSNKKVDSDIKSYIGAIALKDQRRYSKLIEQALLRDTPVIFPYFYNYLQATSKRLVGYKGNAIGQTYLSRSSLSA